MNYNYHIYNIGDHALVLDGGQNIDPALHAKIVGLADLLKESAIPGLKDLIVAYASLTIYYDPFQLKQYLQIDTTVFDALRFKVQQLFDALTIIEKKHPQRFYLPVCYDLEFGKDLFEVANICSQTPERIIEMHTSQPYTIYMIGFIPGFAYMASLANELQTPRKKQPERVAAGSVAIAGIQTGIYPFESPGGWNIIGRTPLKVFDPQASVPVRWQPGDVVQFQAISKEQFDYLLKDPSVWVWQ